MREAPIRISVVIPTYNAADYLALAIDSALAQDVPGLEVIVLDNASTDDTPAVMARYDDPRLIHRRNASNLGFAGNVAIGCGLMRGEYVLFLGADDRLLPGFLAAATARLDEDPDLSMVHGPAYWIDEKGRRFGGTGHAWAPVTPGRRAMLGAFDQGFCFSTMLMRTALIRSTGALNQDWQEILDLWLFLRMCLAGDVGYLPEALCEYRVHKAAISMGMYRDNLMFRRQMTAAREAFGWPQAVALGAAGQRRAAERAAGMIAVSTAHMARPLGRRRYLGAMAEIVGRVPEVMLRPQFWLRLAFGLAPLPVMERLQRLRHRRSLDLAGRGLS